MSPKSLRPAAASPFRSLRSLLEIAIVSLVILSGPQLLRGAQPGPLPMEPEQKHVSVAGKLPPATVAVDYNASVSASGGKAPYQFRQQDLPSDFVLNQKTGGISGKPRKSGQFPFVILVVDSNGLRGSAQFTLAVSPAPVVSVTISPATATVASSGTQQFQATVTNASNSNVTWKVSVGSMSSGALYTAPAVTANTAVLVTATSVADSTKSATANISITSKPAPMVALEVLFPPTNPYTKDFKKVQTYLMTNPIVSGGNLAVEWGMIDQGPTSIPQYDWTALDSAIAPWVAAGKKVNLIVWANSDSTVATCRDGSENTTGNCGIPSYVWRALGPSNYTTCDTQYGTQRIPNYLDIPNFQTPYKQFIVAVTQKYGSNSSIGYIRFGLGHGGETFPVTGWNNNATACGQAFASWGATIATWENYLEGMLNYEASLHSSKQLMVGVTPMGIPNTQVPNFVAPIAVPLLLGFGSQGLQQTDIATYPACTGDWCNLFAQYRGQVPLELQTVGQSDPTGAGSTGSLVTLVPFAISHHASILEIYYQDWLVAFAPGYPGNSEYGAAYAQVLTQAAKTPVQ